MIPQELRHELVEKLLRVPVANGDGGYLGRTSLLGGIPHSAIQRNRANAETDTRLIVNYLEESFGPYGEWRLLEFLDAAVATVPGAKLETELRQIRAELLAAKERHWPARRQPAELGQIHNFDLRLPVRFCTVSLMDRGCQVSGFVINTPTHRLLRYFCERLRQHGESEELWRRDQVAEPKPALVINPMHTPVPLAPGKLDEVRARLAWQHVIWPIYVTSPDDARVLWQQLAAAFGAACDHHLVVTFGMPAGAEVPAGMTVLPEPRFTRKDIADWINPIGAAVPLDTRDVERWASVIEQGCAAISEALPIEIVYEQLELHYGLLTRNRHPTTLMLAVNDLAT
jgi:hypothetical protein